MPEVRLGPAYRRSGPATSERTAAAQPASNPRMDRARNPAPSEAVTARHEPSQGKTKAVIPGEREDHGLSSTPTGSTTPPRKGRKTSVAEAPGTKPGTPAVPADVHELLRLLAGLTPEERAALIEAARSATRSRLRSRARVSETKTL